jgi:uncharacterized protein
MGSRITTSHLRGGRLIPCVKKCRTHKILLKPDPTQPPDRSSSKRIYEFLNRGGPTPVRGRFRKAISDDRSLMVSWVEAFHAEIGEPLPDPELLVDGWPRAGQLWLWDNGETMSMAVGRDPVEGVVQVSGVYTPTEQRRHSYAAACVQGLSELMREAAYHCILYTDLANPTSNSIYGRIGYRAIAEGLRYRFE